MAWLGLIACAERYVAADLQLDVRGAFPVGVETLRVCVDGLGTQVQGFGNGRAFVAGVPDDDVSVALTFIDVDGAPAGGVVEQVFGEATWREAAWEEDAPPCRASDRGERGGRALAIRFTEEPW